MPRQSTEFIRFDPHDCIACWRCVEACPKQVIGKVRLLWHKHAVLKQRDNCIGCGKCVRICPENRFTKLASSRS